MAQQNQRADMRGSETERAMNDLRRQKSVARTAGAEVEEEDRPPDILVRDVSAIDCVGRPLARIGTVS
jgi:hypothetical protein